MKSEEIFPKHQRNDTNHTDWIRFVRHDRGNKTELNYVSIEDYCKLLDALEWAEGEVLRLQVELEIRKAA